MLLYVLLALHSMYFMRLWHDIAY